MIPRRLAADELMDELQERAALMQDFRANYHNSNDPADEQHR